MGRPVKKDYLILGKRKQLRKKGYKCWESYFVKPSGKYWKRKASKAVRRSNNVQNGGWYRKVFGWFEWS